MVAVLANSYAESLVMKPWLVIVFIIFCGIFLRLWQLGAVPDGLTWDEAAIGYNGWSVWTTRRDEWLQRLPASFKSFGDFKAPLAIYLNGPFTLVFGMHPWSIRLPFALAGSTLLFVWYFFLRRLHSLDLIRHEWAIVFGVAALSFSPWHLMFSRIGFESGLSLLLLVSGVFALLWYVLVKQTWWLSLGSASLFVLSMYAYHSAKIVVPLLLITFFVMWRKVFLKHFRQILATILFGVVLLSPMVYDTVLGEGGTRAGGLIPLSGKSGSEQLQMFGESISANLRPAFLITGAGDEPRHVSGVYGPLTISTVLLTLVGVSLLFGKNSEKLVNPRKKIGVLAGLWILIGFLPSFLSVESPHANRALLALPGVLLLATLAVDQIVSAVASKAAVRRYVLPVLIGLFLIELVLFGGFIVDYFTKYSARATDSFQTGYTEAMQLAATARHELPPFGGVEQILFSSNYGQPVIYALANVDGEKPVSPYQYHQGYLVKYSFPGKITSADLFRKNTLLIWTINDEVDVEPMGTISDRAGQPRFYWYVTPGE